MDESPGKMYALTAVLTTIALVAVPLRFYTRRIQDSPLGVDDWLMLPALLFTVLTGVAIIIATALGNLGQHSLIVDGAIIDTPETVVFQKATYYTLLTQTLTFGLTKISLLFFYKRVFRGKAFNCTVWTALTIVIIWTVAFFFANLLQCVPIWVRWTQQGLVQGHCIDENAMYVAQASSDILTDVGILCIPMPWLWRLQMRTQRKIAISCMFLLGSLVVVAGIAKLVAFNSAAAVFSSGDQDLSYYLTPTQYWPMVESSLGILGACLPTYQPLFRRFSQGSIVKAARSIVPGLSTGSNSQSQKGKGLNRGDKAGAFELLEQEDTRPQYQNTLPNLASDGGTATDARWNDRAFADTIARPPIAKQTSGSPWSSRD